MKIKILSLSVLLFVLAGCSKSFLDVNISPNSVTDVPPKTLLPTATVGIAFSNSNELGKAAALVMQISTGIVGNSQSYDRWNFGTFDNQWNNELYTIVVNNLNILINKTQAQSPAYAGVAKLELAYTFSMITDLFGDVPYSQAGQGLDENGVIKFAQPRFDPQMDIYLGNSANGVKSLFNLVREGLADIASPSANKPGADDLVYGGDLAKWTRFGNSLLLKFALQVSNKVPDTTRNVINAVIAGKNFISDTTGSQDFNVPFTKANPNAYYQQDIGGSIPATQMLSSRFLALERSLNDSIRLSKFFLKPAATFVGHENGSPFTAPVATTRSYYGPYLMGATRSGEAPIRLMTAFRNYFILAESALRFGTTGDPNTYYQSGIRAAMISAGLTPLEIENYFSLNPTIVTLNGSPAQKMQQIFTQKYVASVGNAIEIYNDYRRLLGLNLIAPLPMPLLTEGDDVNNFPVRFPYTTNEGASNPNQPNPRPKTSVKVWWAN